mmetsp:Transcript_2890/g.3385  ORF Transcript_2890/g.3385 Transcript_2890/m.3385 type:complete len:575 (+) Transcript_2890:41-1765(+)|eukprot:CAMPEP_0205822018 /NCGR_PEP_ID=MMETSP0206-20130828/10801_1 /ASSEMBLY_ACC=CAM_ASM_000279 /TAXON_ID=36767 /ORGANISM="Euplotes focardii, Strain TN1" /LENGTH=574 /DNA_ID=CAMNT_0053117947 /DNA_START=41 /DNA_END=1765 /DNA_ORIENTATION=-
MEVYGSVEGCWTIVGFYGVIWFLLMFPGLLPLARPTTALMGAIAVMTVRSVDEQLSNGVLPSVDKYELVDFGTLGLLFGLMMVSYFVEETGFFGHAERFIDSQKGWQVVLKIHVFSYLSCIFMNDTICLVFTGVIVNWCQRKKIEPYVYLLALATTANIASAMTITGNPQNHMIGEFTEEIVFTNFVGALFLPVMSGMILNFLMLCIGYRSELMCDIGQASERSKLVHENGAPGTPRGGTQAESIHLDHFDPVGAVGEDMSIINYGAQGGGVQCRFCRVDARVVTRYCEACAFSFCETCATIIHPSIGPFAEPEHELIFINSIASTPRADRLHKILAKGKTTDLASEIPPEGSEGEGTMFVLFTFCSVLLMVVAFVVGLAADSVAFFAGILLLVFFAVRKGRERKKEGGKVGDDVESDVILSTKVDYPLLLLFVGQFVMVGTVVETGLPTAAFQATLGAKCGEDLLGECLPLFLAVVLIFSNTLSNVPLMILLKPFVELTYANSSDFGVWTMTAWSATVAGNFTMIGSAANLIVASQAQREGYFGFTSGRHLKFGFISTLVILPVGAYVMEYFA